MRRYFIACALVGTLAVLSGCSRTEQVGQGTVTVFEGDSAYQARPELEVPWYGTLQTARSSDLNQNGLYYALAYGQKTQAIYTGEVLPQLEGFLGKEVVVRGKLLAEEGSAARPELWPATVKQNEARLMACWLEGEPMKPEDKLAPKLKTWLAERPGEERERLLLTFCDDIGDLTPDFDIEELEALREPLYVMLREELKAYGVEVFGTTWMLTGMSVEMPLGAVPELAKRPDVLYIEPSFDGSPPPD